MSSQHIKDQAPPILDFSAFKDSDKTARAILVQQIQDACRDKGFFQITNHGIAPELQEKVFAATKALFALPMEEKLKVQRSTSSPYRGYTGVGTQRFEAAAADTKESFYLGREAGTNQKLAGKPQWAPNIWPEAIGEDVRNSCSEYHKQIFNLAVCVLEAIGAGLGLEASYFKPYITDPVTVLRLIHYPPTPPTDHIARGIGAHRDFGGITLLMQDEVGGLQVQNEQTGEWIDVEPVPNAYVVNLGNLMMRWANHRYTSNIHRVINTSARDRYSVPFFLAGNQDYVFDCLPGCEDKVEGGLKTKYQPISVGAYIAEQAKASYGEVKS